MNSERRDVVIPSGPPSPEGTEQANNKNNDVDDVTKPINF